MEREYKVSVKFFSPFYQGMVYYLNRLLIFLSLRKKRKFWGVVYDSVSKQPLDPAIVKLLYVDGHDTQTCVTDLSGRYGFLAHPGKFKLFAKKTNYSFPSKIISGDKDGIYANIYHGEFFELLDDYEFIAPNIPMDPVRSDWNQSAKLSHFKAHPYRDYLISRLVLIYFWFVFTMMCLSLWAHWGKEIKVPAMVLAVYGILFLLSFLVPQTRLWGKVKQKVFFEGELRLELHNPLTQSVIFGKSVVLPDGRFFLRANPGRYLLVVKYMNPSGEVAQIGSKKVRVGGEGTLNISLKIR